MTAFFFFPLVVYVVAVIIFVIISFEKKKFSLSLKQSLGVDQSLIAWPKKNEILKIKSLNEEVQSWKKKFITYQTCTANKWNYWKRRVDKAWRRDNANKINRKLSKMRKVERQNAMEKQIYGSSIYSKCMTKSKVR